MPQCAFFCGRTPGCTGYNIENTAATHKHCELSAYADTEVNATIYYDNNYDFYAKVNSGLCPADFVEFRGNCYYTETLNTKPWQEARDHCISIGADLVSLESPGEIDFLTAHFPTYWWTGGNDIAVETQWVWAATGRQVDECHPLPWAQTPGVAEENDHVLCNGKMMHESNGRRSPANYACEYSP
ncbi:PREDICTED: uncharacterized protein LOC106819940 [Priapulus caudatus]|uniref:Uncharacterized protein LOC106819940 n=1 Tax=Priapulus caudatus TaxID=37621 RepID=A0ABM1F6C2_PRICU|nr:PREDICTED: uncharacterized protein LOC106819940 [Priapulus caudatus]